MKYPARSKGQTAIQVVEEMQGDGKKQKFYPSLLEEECVQLSIQKKKANDQQKRDKDKNTFYGCVKEIQGIKKGKS